MELPPTGAAPESTGSLLLPDLPDGVLALIFQKLSPQDVYQASQACRELHLLITEAPPLGIFGRASVSILASQRTGGPPYTVNDGYGQRNIGILPTVPGLSEHLGRVFSRFGPGLSSVSFTLGSPARRTYELNEKELRPSYACLSTALSALLGAGFRGQVSLSYSCPVSDDNLAGLLGALEAALQGAGAARAAADHGAAPIRLEFNLTIDTDSEPVLALHYLSQLASLPSCNIELLAGLPSWGDEGYSDALAGFGSILRLVIGVRPKHYELLGPAAQALEPFSLDQLAGLTALQSLEVVARLTGPADALLTLSGLQCLELRAVPTAAWDDLGRALGSLERLTSVFLGVSDSCLEGQAGPEYPLLSPLLLPQATARVHICQGLFMHRQRITLDCFSGWGHVQTLTIDVRFSRDGEPHYGESRPPNDDDDGAAAPSPLLTLLSLGPSIAALSSLTSLDIYIPAETVSVEVAEELERLTGLASLSVAFSDRGPPGVEPALVLHGVPPAWDRDRIRLAPEAFEGQFGGCMGYYGYGEWERLVTR